jgi:hypothetical protein
MGYDEVEVGRPAMGTYPEMSDEGGEENDNENDNEISMRVTPL